MSFPTPFTVQVKRQVQGTKNARGNAGITYADPVDWTVHSIVPGAGEAVTSRGGEGKEPREPNRDLSLIEFTILAPDDDQVPGEHDLVVVYGDDYEIEGRPDRWADASPWGGLQAPAVVRLRRAEG